MWESAVNERGMEGLTTLSEWFGDSIEPFTSPKPLLPIACLGDHQRGLRAGGRRVPRVPQCRECHSISFPLVSHVNGVKHIGMVTCRDTIKGTGATRYGYAKSL